MPEINMKKTRLKPVSWIQPHPGGVTRQTS